MKEYECTGCLNISQENLNITCIMSLFTRFGLNYLRGDFLFINHILNKNNPNIIFKKIRPDDFYSDVIQKEVIDFLDIKPDKNSYYYLTGELFSNIENHSHCNNANFSAQLYPDKKLVDWAVIDDELSIPYSYEENPSQPDNVYIDQAVSGKSTKNEALRGYGLRTTTNYITKI